MRASYFFIVLLCAAVLLNPFLAIAENPPSLKITAAAKEGFENNVFLDSSRKGDWFTETAVYAEGDYKITDRLNAGIEYYFTDLAYHEYADLNLMNNEGCAFLKYYLGDDFSIKAGYIADSVWYQHDKDGTYLALGQLGEIEYYINKNLFFRGAYEFKEYDYDKKKIKDGTGLTLNTDREDYRHTMMFSIGQYIKELLIKTEGEIDFNDSNDEYMDYYDYTAYKTSTYVSVPVFKVFYLTGHGSYRWKCFDSRKNADLSARETQKTMTLGVTAYYNICKSAYISAGYTYIQNYSDEPSHRYSDSITTTGVHIFF